MERIIQRSAALGATKSEYAALVILHWMASGCPPVNDEEMRLLDQLGSNAPADPAP
jgi:hypothetical protein